MPFEVDRAAPGEFIDYLKDQKKRMVAARGEVAQEKFAVTLRYREWNREQHKYVEKSFNVWRADWNAVKEEQEKVFAANNRDAYRGLFYQNGWADFDTVLQRDLANRDQEIDPITKDIAEFRRRYDNWKQTYVRQAGQWMQLELAGQLHAVGVEEERLATLAKNKNEYTRIDAGTGRVKFI